MKKIFLFAAFYFLLAPFIYAQAEDYGCDEAEDPQFPYDNFFIQRAYPDFGDILPGLENAKRIARQKMAGVSRGSGYNIQWQIEGPINIGGRVNVVAVDPTDTNVIYAGTANGGIFKTTDGGVNWASAVDTLSYFAVGDIKIDPTNHNIIYAGLGDPNISGTPAIGNGVLKSTDGGNTWHNIGLWDTRIISKIEIHPLNHNLVYAGTMGLPYARDNKRGLYKSTNGGQTWNQVLYTNDSSGVIDVLLDQTDTNVVYAVTWNRLRQNLFGLISGPDAKIWKSTNGGATWQQLTNGLPAGPFSRIAIAQSAQNHNTLYAEYVDPSTLDLYGIYKTTDAGASWTALDISQLSSQQVQGGFGWYFGNLTVNPYNDNQIFVLGVDLWTTTDGSTWSQVGPAWWSDQLHADKHCLRFIGSNSMLVCTDGGLYKTTDAGMSWPPINQIPNTQFYHVAYNPNQQGMYYGGAQDNGTSVGNISSISNWASIYGGDGFQQRFNPANPNVWYTETQYGAIVYTDNNGGSFNDATSGIDASDPHNWDTPYILSSGNPNTMYTSTTRVYKSTGSYIPAWQPVSTTLTKPVTGNDVSFRFISTIDESPVNNNLIYAGTTDGNVWRSADAGNNWQDITAQLPNRYVTRVKASNIHDNVVLVAHSGYKDNDNLPHIFASYDSGSTWHDISGDLPPFAVNDIELSHVNDSLIFVATDGGVYYTLNRGANWNRLGTNMPLFVVYDIELDEANKKLIAGTFARSVWSIGVDSVLSSFAVALAVGGNDTICAGSSAYLHVSGASGYTWSPSTTLSCSNCPNPVATPASTTSYIVTGSNGNATATDTITVVVIPLPNTPAVVQSGDTLYATGGTNYQWFLNGAAISGANNSFFVPTENGAYYVQSNNNYGCTASSNTVTLINVGINELATDALFHIYPNPFGDKLNIEKLAAGNWRMTISDISGRTLANTNIELVKTEIDMSGFSSGIYTAAISNGQYHFVKRLVRF